MRLWSLHPRYLDRQGLTALWREALLARHVLRGLTRGYRHHPQLQRFQSHAQPRRAISFYLSEIHAEALLRGYRFDRSKVGPVTKVEAIPVTDGQMAYEWEHLIHKLAGRSPAVHEQWLGEDIPSPHPLFYVVPGSVEPWERL